MTASRPMAGAPPLRFLVIVLGGWALLRGGALLLWPEPPASETAARAAPEPAAPAGAPSHTATIPPTMPDRHDPIARPGTPDSEVTIAAFLAPMPASPTSAPPDWTPASVPAIPAESALPALLPAPGVPPGVSRWSGSAWLLLRDDGGAPALAPGGTLGGSQAGARLLYRLGAGLSLSGRAYAPLRRTAGSEVALGLDWHPLPQIPVRLLAERRIGLGREGRDAFALTLYGGHSAHLGGVAVDAYVQTGVVGLKSRDLFIDGAVRAGLPLGPVEIGGGAWGAAQPGAARLDAGPQLSWRLPRARLRVSADWRFRLAGEAAPGSGPALTVGADF